MRKRRGKKSFSACKWPLFLQFLQLYFVTLSSTYILKFIFKTMSMIQWSYAKKAQISNQQDWKNTEKLVGIHALKQISNSVLNLANHDTINIYFYSDLTMQLHSHDHRIHTLQQQQQRPPLLPQSPPPPSSHESLFQTLKTEAL